MCACQKFLEHPKPYKIFGAFILRSSLPIFLVLFSLNTFAQNEVVDPTLPEIPVAPLKPENVDSPVDPEKLEEPVEAVAEEKPEVEMEKTGEVTTESENPEDADKSVSDSEKGIPYGDTEGWARTQKEGWDNQDNDPEITLVGEEGLSMLSQAVGRMVVGLSVVLAMILILYYLARRYGKNMPALSGYQLGQVVGQVHLTRTATLHYVKSGGRILVIGVNDGGVNLVAEYDESAFATISGAPPVQGQFDPDSFVDELKQQTAVMRGEDTLTNKSEVFQDDDISALRGDINRLQDYLQEENREKND